MRSSRIRSLLLTAVLLAFCGLGWIYLAPTQIGGSTRYMVTHGISMEPMLHTGDLVLVRPAGEYRVGQVVAYQSTLLRTIVLHRIIRIHNGRYTFKGDNNHFIDPTHPTRSLLVGRMWLHVPHGGTVLGWIHKPWVAAALTAGVAMLLLFGGGQTRRRRRGRQGVKPARPRRGPAPVANRYLLSIGALGAALAAALSVFAFLQPALAPSTVTSTYTQQLDFRYHAAARPGSVYPSGQVRTGDPIYLQLVHRLTVTAAYRLTTSAPHDLTGTMRIRGTLSNDSGWSRSFWLGPATGLVDDRGVATADINLARLQALGSRISNQIGEGAVGSYTLAVEPQVKLTGELAGARPPAFSGPALNLALGAGQLQANAPPAAGGAAAGGSSLDHSVTGSVSSSGLATKRLLGLPVKTVRWIGLAAFALFGLLALITGTRELNRTPDPAERINGRYRHLIVPVASVAHDPAHPPIEVRTIEALVRLAERSERLILHQRDNGVDSYLIDDQGTLFRYRSQRPGISQVHDAVTGAAVSAADTVAASAAEAASLQPASAGAAPEPAAGSVAESGGGLVAESGGGLVAESGGGVSVGRPAAEEPHGTGAQPELTASRGPSAAAADSHSHSLGDGDVIYNEQAPALTGAAVRSTSTAAGSQWTARSSAGTDRGTEGNRTDAGATEAETAAGAERAGGAPRSTEPPPTHWSRRPAARAGITAGPVALVFLMWRTTRRRRRLRRQAEADQRWSTRNDRRRDDGPAPGRGPGDRRRGDRRRNR